VLREVTENRAGRTAMVRVEGHIGIGNIELPLDDYVTAAAQPAHFLETVEDLTAQKVAPGGTGTLPVATGWKPVPPGEDTSLHTAA